MNENIKINSTTISVNHYPRNLQFYGSLNIEKFLTQNVCYKNSTLVISSNVYFFNMDWMGKTLPKPVFFNKSINTNTRKYIS